MHNRSVKKQLEGTWEFKDEGVEYNEYMGSIKKMKIGDHLASHSFLSGYIEYRWTDKMYEQAKALGGEEFKNRR